MSTRNPTVKISLEEAAERVMKLFMDSISHLSKAERVRAIKKACDGADELLAYKRRRQKIRALDRKLAKARHGR